MIERLSVRLADRPESRVVGEMVDAGSGPYFQYDSAFLATGLQLSPLALPLRLDAYEPGPRELGRLRGLFADAVPDGWGLKMLHQSMIDAGLDPLRASRLMHLRAVGARAMGALTFHPSALKETTAPPFDLEAVAANALRVDADDVEQILPALKRAGGTSGGVRPKVVVSWHPDGTIGDAFAPLRNGFRHVLVKFRAHEDWRDLPVIESAYLAMAERAGLIVPMHRVRRLHSGEYAFIVDRFDRVGDQRRHVHTLAGMLEIDTSNALVDYEQLLKVTARITEDMRQVQAAWRRAVFNVAAFNRDDHAKNIAFTMDPTGRWTLAPAYDLTFSSGPGGYHAMSVAGESREPTRAHLERLAVDLNAGDVAHIIDEVRSATELWKGFAETAGVSTPHIREVDKQLRRQSLALGRRDTPKPRSPRKRR